MAAINFESLAQHGASVFSGKEKGTATRKHFNLDILDETPEVIEVIIPSGIDVITPSFVTGMFSKSAKTLGSLDSFFDKYRFNASVSILKQISIGINSSLVAGNAFTKLK